MPLIEDRDLTVEEVSQYRLLQIKVLEKVSNQLYEFYHTKQDAKFDELTKLLMAYGHVSNQTMKYDPEGELNKQAIFDMLMRY